MNIQPAITIVELTTWTAIATLTWEQQAEGSETFSIYDSSPHISEVQASFPPAPPREQRNLLLTSTSFSSSEATSLASYYIYTIQVGWFLAAISDTLAQLVYDSQKPTYAFNFYVSFFTFLCMLGTLDMLIKSYMSRRMGVTSMNTIWTGKDSSKEKAVCFKLINSREVSLCRISLAWSVLTQLAVHIILYWPSKEKQVQHNFFCESNPASSNHPHSQSPRILYPTVLRMTCIQNSPVTIHRSVIIV